ncbi:hypothetical protein ScPMuIL_009717 [Solemya velum]
MKFGLKCLENGKLVPLKEVTVSVLIQGFVASVEATLVYENRTGQSVNTAYLFPVNQLSAVYKFEAYIEERHIVCECQKKEQARQTFKHAVSRSKTAVLLEETESSGVFQCYLGNLKPGTRAQLTIGFVTELDVEENKTLTFTLPTVLNPRYRSPTFKFLDFRQSFLTKGTKEEFDQNCTAYRLMFNCEVSSSYHIEAIDGGTDRLDIHFSQQRKLAKIQLIEDFRCDHDLTLKIRYEDLDQPHAILERGRSDLDGLLMCSVMMLNFFPSAVNSESAYNGEYIFMVDISENMTANQILSAGEALFLFLKSLPMGCFFNVVTFHKTFSILFSGGSVLYSETSLKMALQLRDNLTASNGEPQLLQPLSCVFSWPAIVGHPRQIVILMNDKVPRLKNVVNLVEKNCTRYNCRVFTVGIGGRSAALVKEVAHAGNGRAEIVTENDKLHQKVMSLIRCCVEPMISDFSVECNLQAGISSICVPQEQPIMFSGHRIILYLLLEGSESRNILRGNIKLKGRIGETPFEYMLPFGLRDQLNLKVDESLPLHRLAAKSMIKELEDEDMPIGKQNELIKQIILISKSANILSQYTSFVGIDKKSSTQLESQVVPGNQKKIPSQGLCETSVLIPGGLQKKNSFYAEKNAAGGAEVQGGNIKERTSKQLLTRDEQWIKDLEPVGATGIGVSANNNKDNKNTGSGGICLSKGILKSSASRSGEGIPQEKNLGLFGQQTSGFGKLGSTFGQIPNEQSGCGFGQSQPSTQPSGSLLFRDSVQSQPSGKKSSNLGLVGQQSSGFGQQTSSFGQMPSQKSGFGFGQSQSSTHPLGGSLFGGSVQIQPSNNQSSNVGLFGQQASGFGQQTFSFGQMPSQQSGSGFGQSQSSTQPSGGSLFGGSVQTQPSNNQSSNVGLFGQQSSGFGQQTSSFGQMPSQQSGFGFGQSQSSTQPLGGSLFGGSVQTQPSNNQSSNVGLFGQQASGFGQQTFSFGQMPSQQSGSGFGQSQSSTQPSRGSLFGGSVQTQHSNNQSSNVGLFGQQSSGFGQQTSSFGQMPSQQSGFGFGQSQSSTQLSRGSLFGGSVQTQHSNNQSSNVGLFGQQSSGFGQQTSSFGQMPSQQSGFGFGQSQSSTQPSGSLLFGDSIITKPSSNQSSTVGLFGQQASGYGFGQSKPSTCSTQLSCGSLFGTIQTQPPSNQSSDMSLLGQKASGQSQQSVQPTTGSIFCSSQTHSIHDIGQKEKLGTTNKFLPATGQESVERDVVHNTQLQCITGMQKYENKSLEELRLEDYAAKRNGTQLPTASSPSTILQDADFEKSTKTAWPSDGLHPQKTTNSNFRRAQPKTAVSGVFGQSVFGSTSIPVSESALLRGFGTNANTETTLFGQTQNNMGETRVLAGPAVSATQAFSFGNQSQSSFLGNTVKSVPGTGLGNVKNIGPCVEASSKPTLNGAFSTQPQTFGQNKPVSDTPPFNFGADTNTGTTFTVNKGGISSIGTSSFDEKTGIVAPNKGFGTTEGHRSEIYAQGAQTVIFNKSQAGQNETVDQGPQKGVSLPFTSLALKQKAGFVSTSKLRHEKMLKIIHIQKIDGSWALSMELAEILSLDLIQLKESNPHEVSDNMWATCLALAWFQTYCREFCPEWEVIEAKARTWIRKQTENPKNTAHVDTENLIFRAVETLPKPL